MSFLSCFSLLECSLLTWPPARDTPVTCLRGGDSPSHRMVRTLLATGTVLESTADMLCEYSQIYIEDNRFITEEIVTV